MSSWRSGSSGRSSGRSRPVTNSISVAWRGTTTLSGTLAAEKVVSLLGAEAVPFSEVSAHHATLEQAYLELTRDAAEFRAADAGAGPPGPAGHGGTPASGPSAVSAQEVAR